MPAFETLSQQSDRQSSLLFPSILRLIQTVRDQSANLYNLHIHPTTNSYQLRVTFIKFHGRL